MADMAKQKSGKMPMHTGLVLRAMIEPRVRQIDIAREAGVSRQYVQAVFAGRRRPSAKIIRACRALGLPVDAVLPRERA